MCILFYFLIGLGCMLEENGLVFDRLMALSRLGPCTGPRSRLLSVAHPQSPRPKLLLGDLVKSPFEFSVDVPGAFALAPRTRYRRPPPAPAPGVPALIACTLLQC